MADAYTTTATLGSVQAAYDIAARMALRPELYFDGMATVKPTAQSMDGSSVIFTIYSEMPTATAALNESVDVDAVAIDDNNVTVTLVERGNAVLTTAKLRGTSFLNVDMDAANLVGFNAGISLDTLAREPLLGGTNVLYPGAKVARNTIVPADTLSAALVRKALARLVAGNVQRWMNGYYKAVVHPDTSHDLRSETGAAAWRDPHTYSDPGAIWTGSIGAFEGFEFLESPRGAIFADSGSATTLTDVYASLFMGREALAKAYSTNYGGAGELPVVVRGAVTDKLMRFQPIGWKWLGGYARFREASLYRVETASSIGANT